MPSNSVNIHKLQKALNSKGCKILYTMSEFWSDEQSRPIHKYKVEQTVKDEDSGRNKRVTLFETCSQIQVVLYLRDLWNQINGLPEDTSNEYWNEVKRKMMENE